jgi:hypothetical protein
MHSVTRGNVDIVLDPTLVCFQAVFSHKVSRVAMANPFANAKEHELNKCDQAIRLLQSELSKLPQEVQQNDTVAHLVASCTAFAELSSAAHQEHAAQQQQTAAEGGGDGETDVLVKTTARGAITDGAAEEEARRYRWAATCVVALLIYIFLWGLAFTMLEQGNPRGAWSFIDGWYFSVLTIGTVGYGVLIPSNDVSRICVVLCLLLGLTFTIYTMGVLCELMLKKMELWLEDFQMKKGAFWHSLLDHRTMTFFFMLFLVRTRNAPRCTQHCGTDYCCRRVADVCVWRSVVHLVRRVVLRRRRILGNGNDYHCWLW